MISLPRLCVLSLFLSLVQYYSSIMLFLFPSWTCLEWRSRQSLGFLSTRELSAAESIALFRVIMQRTSGIICLFTRYMIFRVLYLHELCSLVCARGIFSLNAGFCRRQFADIGDLAVCHFTKLICVIYDPALCLTNIYAHELADCRGFWRELAINVLIGADTLTCYVWLSGWCTVCW